MRVKVLALANACGKKFQWFECQLFASFFYLPHISTHVIMHFYTSSTYTVSTYICFISCQVTAWFMVKIVQWWVMTFLIYRVSFDLRTYYNCILEGKKWWLCIIVPEFLGILDDWSRPEMGAATAQAASASHHLCTTRRIMADFSDLILVVTC